MLIINFKYRQSAFTLIEVLIALIVLAVGMVGVIQLQTSLLSATRESEMRSLAYAVAEAKIESLRNYQEKSDFYLINTASLAASSQVQVKYGESSTIDFDFLSSSVVTFDDSGSVVAYNSGEAKYKEIKLQVNWNGSESVVLNTIIGLVDPALSSIPDTGNLGGKTKPDVSHIAGEVPNVIPITIASGAVRETSKPLPDVDSSGDSTEVRFETVNYTPKSANTDSTKTTREDFLTVNCFCNLVTYNPASTGQTPYHYKYNPTSDELEIRQGSAVSVATSGVVAAELVAGNPSTKLEQSPYCSKCCSDHHDPEEVDLPVGYPSYKYGVVSAAHPHYLFDVGSKLTTSVVASTAGNLYAEACRFRRVDGIYQLFPDWRLVDLITFSYDLGSSSDFISNEYTPYVINRITNEVLPPSTASISTDTTVHLITGGESVQALARGIYIDKMEYDDDWKKLISDVANSTAWKSNPDRWLYNVPFNEINMTLLANWDSVSSAIASVSSDAVRSISNVVSGADYYLTEDKTGYSRGLVTPKGVGSTYVVASSRIDNTGILSNRYKEDFYNGNDNAIASVASISASLPVQVTSSTTETTITLFGYIYPTQYTYEQNVKGTKTLYGYTTHLDDITVTFTDGSSSSGSCNYVVKTGVSTSVSVTGERGEFTCVLEKNKSYRIDFVDSPSATEVEFTSIQTPKPSEETANGKNYVELKVGVESISGFDFDLEIDKNNTLAPTGWTLL